MSRTRQRPHQADSRPEISQRASCWLESYPHLAYCGCCAESCQERVGDSVTNYRSYRESRTPFLAEMHVRAHRRMCRTEIIRSRLTKRVKLQQRGYEVNSSSRIDTCGGAQARR